MPPAVKLLWLCQAQISSAVSRTGTERVEFTYDTVRHPEMATDIINQVVKRCFDFGIRSRLPKANYVRCPKRQTIATHKQSTHTVTLVHWCDIGLGEAECNFITCNMQRETRTRLRTFSLLSPLLFGLCLGPESIGGGDPARMSLRPTLIGCEALQWEALNLLGMVTYHLGFVLAAVAALKERVNIIEFYLLNLLYLEQEYLMSLNKYLPDQLRFVYLFFHYNLG